jgi:hypothetical protein
MTDIEHTAKFVLDVLSLGTVLSTLMGWLPPFAAFMSIIWLGMQIHDRIRYGHPQGHKHARREDGSTDVKRD